MSTHSPLPRSASSLCRVSATHDGVAGASADGALMSEA